jgi:hypothetical protein
MRDVVLNVLHCLEKLAFSPSRLLASGYGQRPTNSASAGAKDLDLCLLTSGTSAIQILDDHRLLAKEPTLPQISLSVGYVPLSVPQHLSSSE